MLNYFAFIIAMIFFNAAHISAVMNGMTTEFYFHSSMFANIFVMLGIITNILFHSKFGEVKKSTKVIKIVFGFLIVGWLLLPFNYEVGAATGFQLKYVTYTLMSIYGIVIYIGLTVSFFKMARVSSQSKKQVIALGLGSLIFLVYFIIIVIFGITQTFEFLMASMICLYASFFCYFLGIYLPKFRSKS
ncbi:MAG: hypothetical protein ACFE96_13185 [Candidatus Hermodarchaeota archaeon]